jgi:hypothetical protein
MNWLFPTAHPVPIVHLPQEIKYPELRLPRNAAEKPKKAPAAIKRIRKRVKKTDFVQGQEATCFCGTKFIKRRYQHKFCSNDCLEKNKYLQKKIRWAKGIL